MQTKGIDRKTNKNTIPVKNINVRYELSMYYITFCFCEKKNTSKYYFYG